MDLGLDNRISITVCGDGGCGKSSITLRLVRSQWTSEYDPTIGEYHFVNTRNPPPLSCPWFWHYARYYRQPHTGHCKLSVEPNDPQTGIPNLEAHASIANPTLTPPVTVGIRNRPVLINAWPFDPSGFVPPTQWHLQPRKKRIPPGYLNMHPFGAALENPTFEDVLSNHSLNHRLRSLRVRINDYTEDSYSVTRTIDGMTYHLNLTDTAGQEEYRGLWAASNLRSDAFLLVYDITNASTLDALSHFHDLIAMEEEQRIDASAVTPVKIVAGNKCDLQSLRQVRASEGLAWAKSRGCGFMETSAREMVNIEETFALIVRRVVEARIRHANGGELPNQQAIGGASNGHPGAKPAQAQFDGTSEKPITTIDPRMMQRRRQQNKGRFWSRLKCW